MLILFKKKSKKGISLLEVVIGISIIFISVVSVVSTYNFFFRTALKNMKIIKSEYLLEEGVEALRSIRDLNWENFSNITIDTEHYLAFNGSAWEVSENNVFIDDMFERKFLITNIYRDTNDNISEIGILDSGSKKIDIFVSWNEFGATTTQSVSIILTNLFE